MRSCKHVDPRFPWNHTKNRLLIDQSVNVGFSAVFWNTTCLARGVPALTGNYAGSLDDTSRSKQRIKVSGEDELKALFSAKTCRKPARVFTLAGGVHQNNHDLRHSGGFSLMFLSCLAQSGVRINVIGASLLLWIAKAEILLTHYLTEGITRSFVGKIQIPQTWAENNRNTLVNPVFQRNVIFWKKIECWQISMGSLSYTVIVKMMLIQMKGEKGNQSDPTFRSLRPEGLQTFRLIDETSWQAANSAVIPPLTLTPHRHVPHSHRPSKKPAGYITKPSGPWQPHTKASMHPRCAAHRSIWSSHDAVMFARQLCGQRGRRHVWELGQVTCDTEELNMSVLSTRDLNEQFHRSRRKTYSLYFRLFNPTRSVQTDDTLCSVSLSRCSCIYHLPGDLLLTRMPQWGKLGASHFISLGFGKKSEWINISTAHRCRLFPIQAVRLPDAKVIIYTANHVCYYGLQKTHNTPSDINFCKHIIIQL